MSNAPLMAPIWRPPVTSCAHFLSSRFWRPSWPSWLWSVLRPGLARPDPIRGLSKARNTPKSTLTSLHFAPNTCQMGCRPKQTNPPWSELCRERCHTLLSSAQLLAQNGASDCDGSRIREGFKKWFRKWLKNDGIFLAFPYSL